MGGEHKEELNVLRALNQAMHARKEYRRGQLSRAKTAAAFDALERAFDLWDLGGVGFDDASTVNAIGLIEAVGFARKKTCADCGRTLYMVETKNGKLAPFTSQGVNHFIDCPGAEKFRRRKPAARGDREKTKPKPANPADQGTGSDT